MPRLFTFGYTGLKGPDGVRALLQPVGVDVVVDVRLSPWSRSRAYNGPIATAATLREAGVRYVHERGLGNLLYREGGIRILEPSRIMAVLGLIREGHVPALMCACQSPVGCHRQAVAALALGNWTDSELSIVDLPVADPVLGL